MAGNRRGFIGIFSPQADNFDSDSQQDLESDNVDDSSEPQAAAKPRSGDAPKAESDWDDVFGEAPRQRSTSSSGSIGAMLASDPALKNGDSKADNAMSEASEASTSGASPISTDKSVAAERSLDKEPDAPSEDVSASAKPEKESTSNHHTHQSTPFTDKLHPSATIMNDHPSSKSALSASDRLAINDAIQTLREKLSFARPSGNDTPGATMQLGSTGRNFVDKAMTAVQQNPDTLPRSFDDERFADDVELAKTLRLIGRDLDSLQKVVTDTEAKISTSTFLGALVVHGTGKIDSETLFRDAYRRGGEGEPAMKDLNSMAMASEPAGVI